MTKTATPLDQKIECPSCRAYAMRKSHPEKIGMEYFCDSCHNYFGIVELVHEWGYDSADFFANGKSQLTPDQWATFIQAWKENEKVRENTAKFYFDEETLDDAIMELLEDAEGEWDSAKEREEAYLVVTHMLLGVDEWDDEDVRNSLPCPICMVGMC
jgi:hypothetical protein